MDQFQQSHCSEDHQDDEGGSEDKEEYAICHFQNKHKLFTFRGKHVPVG